jgi:serine/threonine protein kinase
VPDPTIPGVEDLVEIGRGGMAVVYRGRQPAFSRDVAVKVVVVAGVDERTRQRFEQECQAVGALSEHPNIVTVHGAGETADGLPYLVMGYQPGGSLADRLRRDGPLPWAEVADLGVKVSGALESAHRAGVLHRDVKPENILVSPFGEPVLADFGIARVTGAAHLTASGMVTGTPAHTAPETLRGEPATAASDVYGLASTLHQLLSGTPAFVRPTDESTLAVMNRVLADPPPDLAALGVPAPLAQVIARGMAKEPAQRYRSARELGQALRRAQETLGLPPTPLPVALEPGTEADSGETVFAAAPIPPIVTTPTPTSSPLPPTGPPTTPVREDEGRPNRTGVIVFGILAVLALAAVLFLVLRDDDGEGGEVLSPPESTAPTTTVATTTTVPPTTTTTPPTTTTEFVVDPADAFVQTLIDPTASSAAPDGVDGAGNPVSYSVDNTIDGDFETAWRTEGDGVGETLSYRFAAGSVYVTSVGLIPGYAKIDPTDGTDRFLENRRIRAVRWIFDGGVVQEQTFADDRDLQTIEIPGVLTRTITIEILETTDHGGRDFTPVSEVQVEGVVGDQ